MRNKERVIFGSLLALGLSFGLSAHACTTDGWNGGAVGATTGSPELFSRFSELCAMKISSAGHVQSNYASDAQYFGRFYIFPDVGGTGEVDLLVAYSDDGASAPLFTISYDGSDFNFDAGVAGGGTGSATAKSGWNLVEFEFNDGGNFNVWVNESWTFPDGPYSSGPTTTFTAGSGTVESVQLGAPNGMGGFTGDIYFDAYEAHRTTNVGALLNCDAEGDADIDINDVLAVVDEVFGVPSILASGQPDCDENGSVNINDALDIVDIVF